MRVWQEEKCFYSWACSLQSTFNKDGSIMGQIGSCLFGSCNSGENQDGLSSSSRNNQSHENWEEELVIKNKQSKTYKNVSKEFIDNMEKHKVRDNCTGFKFHKRDPCCKCILIAIKADFDNKYYQPGGPYGFTQLGFVENFDIGIHHNEENPVPYTSPYCPRHFPTLESRAQGYNRCNESSPLCPNQAVRTQTIRAHSC